MGLLDRFIQWRATTRIHTLEQAVATRPTPGLYLQLADAHKEAGNPTKCAQVLKIGAARFPSAPDVVRRQAEAERQERESDKKRLVDKIQNHPNPILYARLAELYKADNEMTKTIDTCQRGIKAFPKYGGTYLVLGQIYNEKKQWPEAVAQLERSVSLDKYNYLALKQLASVYVQLNRPADAAKRLEDILFFAPGDESVLALLKTAREAAGISDNKLSLADAAASVSKGAASSASKSGFSRSVSGPRPASGMSRPTGMSRPSGLYQKPAVTKDSVLAKGLASLRAIHGVMGAILVDQYGLVIASDLDASLDETLAGALITNVYRSASNHTQKLGVGQFEEGFVEGSEGNMHIVQFDDMILTVFARPDVKLGMLEKSIRDFAEAALHK